LHQARCGRRFSLAKKVAGVNQQNAGEGRGLRSGEDLRNDIPGVRFDGIVLRQRDELCQLNRQDDLDTD